MTPEEEQYITQQLEDIIMQKRFEELLIGEKGQTEAEFHANCMTWDTLFNKTLTDF